MLLDKHVHKVKAHVGRIAVELEEPAVVSLSKGFPDLESVLNALVFLVFFSQRLHDFLGLHVHTNEDLVQNLVSQELCFVTFV